VPPSPCCTITQHHFQHARTLDEFEREVRCNEQIIIHNVDGLAAKVCYMCQDFIVLLTFLASPTIKEYEPEMFEELHGTDTPRRIS
jgi:hypothetical protein